MVVPYVVVGNPNELAIVSGVGYSEPRYISDGFAVVVACFHKVSIKEELARHDDRYVKKYRLRDPAL